MKFKIIACNRLGDLEVAHLSATTPRGPVHITASQHGPHIELFAVLEGRDDVHKLNIPPAAKRYARRKGLKSMLRQPDDWIHVMSLILNVPGKKFTNKTVGKIQKLRGLT